MNAPDPVPLRLTEFSHGGGCGCKIAPGVLTDILKASPLRALPAALLAGKVAVKGKVVVAILSGANVDPELFHRLVA